MKREPTVIDVQDDWDDEDINEEELLAMEWENSVQNSNVGHQNHAPVKTKQDGGIRPGTGNAQTDSRTNVNPSSNSHGSNMQCSTSNHPGYGNVHNNGRTTTSPLSSISHRHTLQQGTSNNQVSSWSQNAKPLSNNRNNTSNSTNNQTGGRPSNQSNQGKLASPFGTNAVPLFKSDSNISSNVVPTFEQASQRSTAVPQTGFGVSAIGQSTKAWSDSGNAGFDFGKQHAAAPKVAIATRIMKQEPLSQDTGSRLGADVSSERERERQTASGPSNRQDFVTAHSMMNAPENNESLAKRRKVEPGNFFFNKVVVGVVWI